MSMKANGRIQICSKSALDQIYIKGRLQRQEAEKACLNTEGVENVNNIISNKWSTF